MLVNTANSEQTIYIYNRSKSQWNIELLAYCVWITLDKQPYNSSHTNAKQKDSLHSRCTSWSANGRMQTDPDDVWAQRKSVFDVRVGEWRTDDTDFYALFLSVCVHTVLLLMWTLTPTHSYNITTFFFSLSGIMNPFVRCV